jgi:hypothetical protein
MSTFSVSLIPRHYVDQQSASPYPNDAMANWGSIQAGEIITCISTGRMWMMDERQEAVFPLAWHWQHTNTSSVVSNAHIRRFIAGEASPSTALAAIELNGEVCFTSLPNAPFLGTGADGRLQAVTAAPAASSVTITARNNTGSQINKGQAVRISGALGQNPTISLAQANAYATTDAVGLAAANILNNATGSVIIAGTLTNLDTSAFSDGATLYLSAAIAGALTATEPSRPNWQMQMGYVEHAHPTQGKILVHPNLESTKTQYITDMTSAGVTLATLAPMSESTLLGRGSGSGAGNPELITMGYGNQMAGLGTELATALTSTQQFITADVTLATANTAYDVTSVSLAAGTWFLTAGAVLTASAGATTSYTIDLQNATSAVVLASSSISHGTVANLPVNASVAVLVTLTATTTIKLRAQANVNARTVKYQSNPGNLPNTTGIVAVRIA